MVSEILSVIDRLSRTLLAAIAGLVAVLVIALGWLFAQSVAEYRSAMRVTEFNRVSDTLFRALTNVAWERGRTNLLLRSPGTADPEHRRFLDERRADGDAALVEAFAVLRRAPAPAYAAALDQAQQTYARLQSLRVRADREIDKPLSKRDLELVRGWFASISQILDVFERLEAAIWNDPVLSEAPVNQLAMMKFVAWQARKSAGAQSAALSAAVAQGVPLTVRERDDVLTWQGAVGLACDALDKVVANLVDPRLGAALQQVQEPYFGKFGRLRDQIVAASRESRVYPVHRETLIEATVAALDSLGRVMEAAAAVTADWAAARKQQARTAMLTEAILFAGVMGILAWLLRALWGRTLHPLRQLSELVYSAADGLITFDASGAIGNFNPAAEAIFGISGAAARKCGFAALAPGLFKAGAAAELEPGIYRGVKGYRNDGTVLLEISIGVLDADRQRRIFAAVIRDISSAAQIAGALEERTRLLELAEEVSATGHWRIDIASKELYWSEEIYRIHGVTPQTYRPALATAIEFYHPEDRPRVRRAIEGALASGEGFDIEAKLIRADGELRYVAAKGRCLRGEQGQLVALFAVFQDITERRRAEEQMQRAERRLEDAMTATNLVWWEAEPATGSVRLGERWAQMLGDPPSGETTTTVTALIRRAHPDERAMLLGTARDAIEGRIEQYAVEHRVRMRNGEWKWIQSRGRVIERDPGGLAVRMIGVNMDIDERKFAEQERIEAQARQQALLDSILFNAWLKDAEGRYIAVNSFFARRLGLGRERIIGKTDVDLFPETVARVLQEEDRRVMASRETLHLERQMERNGAPYWMETIKVPFTDAQGRVMGTSGTSRDVTDRKRAEEELLRAKEEAERANNAKSEFLSRMSHELRTPLNAILGFAQLIESDETEPLTSSQKSGMSQITKAGWHLLSLIDEVLDLAKIESGRIQLSVEPVSVADVARECALLIAPLAEEQGLVFRDEASSSDCPQVYGDAMRLKQVMLNLLSNAVKYNRRGGSITFSCAHIDGGRVRITVADTGRGLTPEQRRHVFEPFNRLGMESSGIEGTGIGLAITRRLVELMRGTLGVVSEAGRGSTFYVELSAVERTEADAAAAAARDEPDEARAVYGKRVMLYVEDNPSNVALMEKVLLRRPQIGLIVARDGWLGLELAQAHRPDLMVIDIHLPGLGGLELCRRLGSLPQTRDIPLIALSANAMPHDVKEGLAAGFRSYLTKPLNVSAFLAAVDAILNGGK